MSVALVGVVGTKRIVNSTSGSCNFGQSATANNLLVLCITAASTTAAANSITGMTAGWTELISGAVVDSATGHCIVDIWYKKAAGADATPTFTVTNLGTGNSTIDTTVFELSGANTTSPLDTSGSQSSGSASSTITSVTTTTAGNVAASGEFGISVVSRERGTAGTVTITYSASWTNQNNDGATSSSQHTGVASFTNPSSGSTLSDVTSYSDTGTGSFSAGSIVVIKSSVTTPNGQTQPLTALASRRSAQRVNNDSWIGVRPAYGGQKGNTRPKPTIQPLTAQPNQRAKGPRVNKDSWIGTNNLAGGIANIYVINFTPPRILMARMGGVGAMLLQTAVNSSKHTLNAVATVISPQGPAIGGTGINWRPQNRYSRAVVGGMNACAAGIQGTLRVSQFISKAIFIQRKPQQRDAANVGPFCSVWGFLHGVLQPGAPPKQINSSRVPPRRTVTRAFIQHIAGPVQAQPRIQPLTTRQPRRTSSRAVTRNSAPYLGQPAGIIQPRSTFQPRRTSARAVSHIGLGPQPFSVPVGSIQPKSTHSEARRYPSRAGLWRSIAGPPFQPPPGVLQPKPTHPEARRYPSRAVTRNVSGAQPNQIGTVQPRVFDVPPRRKSARAVVASSKPYLSVPAGTQQPLTVRQPRRGTARAVTKNVSGPQPNQIGVIQGVTTRQPRRTSARAVVLGSKPYQGAPAGIVQSAIYGVPPRRKTSRAVTAHISGPQPNLTGTVQPRVFVIPPRRKTARAVVLGSKPYLSVPNGTVQSAVYDVLPRRKTARAVTLSSAPFLGRPVGTVQGVTTRQPRRSTARAVVRNISGVIASIPFGTLQPEPTAPIQRRERRTRVWVGNAFGPYGGVIGSVAPPSGPPAQAPFVVIFHRMGGRAWPNPPTILKTG